MLLYRGSQFVKGNTFKDIKNNKLVFEKNTKNGKLFKSDKGYVTLTESQTSKLVLCEKKHRQGDFIVYAETPMKPKYLKNNELKATSEEEAQKFESDKVAYEAVKEYNKTHETSEHLIITQLEN